VTSKNHEASSYAVFSSLLLFRPPQAKISSSRPCYGTPPAYGKVKVQLILQQPTKALRGSTDIAALLTYPRRYMRWVVNATPRPLYPRKRPGTRGIGGWVGPQGLSGRARKISPVQGFDPRTVQTVASRYTDRAIPAHCQLMVFS
jgi:hypothetical protein